MKVLDLFGLKFFDERVLRFRYVVFLNQLKPKIFFEKQLMAQYEVIRLDEGVVPKVSVNPDMGFLNTIINRLIQFFEGLQYKETKNAIIYYEDEGIYMLSKSTGVPVLSKGITPKTVVRYSYMPEQMMMVLDSMINQIRNYYVAHWSHVLMYYNYVKRV